MTFSIQFSGRSGALAGEWFAWEQYPISHDVNKILEGLKSRYQGYDWRAI